MAMDHHWVSEGSGRRHRITVIMESRRNGPQLSSRHDDDDDNLPCLCSCLSENCNFLLPTLLNDDAVAPSVCRARTHTPRGSVRTTSADSWVGQRDVTSNLTVPRETETERETQSLTRSPPRLSIRCAERRFPDSRQSQWTSSVPSPKFWVLVSVAYCSRSARTCAIK